VGRVVGAAVIVILAMIGTLGFLMVGIAEALGYAPR
jgi:hypothetical protein